MLKVVILFLHVALPLHIAENLHFIYLFIYLLEKYKQLGKRNAS